MITTKIKVKNLNSNYSIMIGRDILKTIPNQIKLTCPKAKKIGLVVDKKIPKKFVNKLKKYLKKYKIFLFEYSVNEKFKSFSSVNKLVEKCLTNNFNRSDVLIAFGGGITGDFAAFAASIFKRGINFINIPTTLLAQVDSSIGGKTGVNSKLGKNLIGSFYQPKLVLSDVDLLESLPHRELICGYAEILKHSLILKNNFFNWLKINSKQILLGKNLNLLQKAIIESCKTKLYFVNKDIHEKNFRMTLNFGHTFAHAIEVQNKYSKRINHGEAVIMGMMLATRFSYLKKICSLKVLEQLKDIYNSNNLKYDIKKIFRKNEYNRIVDHMCNDKKNNDKKINLILLRKIGIPTSPNAYKISPNELKKVFSQII
ncbi:3-dehydroquinate synthase [Pelagibacteraceae bacterium]|jgi:3-dehydroquinate synthase|nr:3-dehydroquinate synthase [Pelagibacteraceae bacterium]